jgi:hypothetical protein
MTFLVGTSLGDGGVGRDGSMTFNSSKKVISVDKEQWTTQFSVFVIVTFF